jgi:hypothetical protein
MKKRIVTPLLLGLMILCSLAVAGDGGARDIAAGTITGDRIAATTITASHLNVSTLSAISGNMGTLTAGSITGGTIDGATINAGSGDEVVLNSSGITFTAGNAGNNQVKWTDGSAIFSESGTIQIDASVGNGGVTIRGDNNVTIEAGLDGSGVVSLTGSGHWVEAPGMRFTTLSGSGTEFACLDADGDLTRSASCGAAPSPAEVAALRQEIAELRAQVAELLAAVQSR